jgi:Transposase, Mutator family
MKFRQTNGPHRAAAKVGFRPATRIWSQPTRGCRHTRSRVDAAAVPDPLAGIWEGEIMPVLKPRRTFARCSRRDTQSSYIAALNMIAIDPGEAHRRAGGETGRCHLVRLSRRCGAHHLHHERIESLNAKLQCPVRTKGHFPTDEAAIKLLYFVLRQVVQTWKMPPREWCEAKTQFAIMFDDRFVNA